MRAWIGALVLGMCALGSAHRLEDWRSDQALWTAAVRVTPALPTAALNLSATYLRHGQWQEASEWTLRAAHLSLSRPAAPRASSQPTLPQIVQTQLAWIDVFYPVCGTPAGRPWCASSW